MASLIKTAPKQIRTFTIGESVMFPVTVPLQNICTTIEKRNGTIVKIKRKTVEGVDEFSNTWRVEMDEII